MIGQAVLYAASRATSSAVDSVTRKITWTAIAAVFLLAAFIVALMLAYTMIAAEYGAVIGFTVIAGGCLGIGLVSLVMPTLIERIENFRRERKSALATTADVVDEEAREAVDHFGALQVIGSAFLFGLGAARRIKKS